MSGRYMENPTGALRVNR
ncbi:hypothetical protein EYZ11_003171 [Aspergillus tanneri]|uniref:Uncharacterized protein n=1 Tax=Aspergillus tanneri TaxID=1220188 RepID=A0A4S3JR33_9EURO|nr:hypothetical protein EYZ11_003171 [Aspergillus tanneri]